MDLVIKFLKKLDAKQQKVIKEILEKLYRRDFYDLDIKKLKGENNHFRVRKGKVRIIYFVSNSNSIHILKIDFRNDITY